MLKTLNYIGHHAIAIIALICSLLALAGASYAALSVPAGSVGTRQLRDNSITPAKLNHRLIGGVVRAWASVAANGRVIAGAGKPRVYYNPGLPGNYPITWGVNLPHACATIATINSRRSALTEGPPTNLTAGYAVVGSLFRGKGRDNNATSAETFDQAGRWRPLGFYIAVIC